MEIQELKELIEDFQDVQSNVCMLEDRFDKMDSFLVTPLEVSRIKGFLTDIYSGINGVNEELTDIKRKIPTTGKVIANDR
ncbi:hypothetical protein GTO87_02830 [Ligilactobacillus saerimneri]|uniref:Uncharacterized protein n=1 Tax=Ligilactobacillus saerimneri TaxID=228229 RepID=A0A7H9EKC5_9LACO|nr:hypothetical protein [Ligilactobacillus saerimneri]QLL77625.1 hypothetical protein GTO87_02830 [Ligilactobacillus saerimneri]